MRTATFYYSVNVIHHPWYGTCAIRSKKTASRVQLFDLPAKRKEYGKAKTNGPNREIEDHEVTNLTMEEERHSSSLT